MHTIHKLILAALAIYCFASCSLSDATKANLRADGKAIIAVAKPIAEKLIEQEAAILIQEAIDAQK